MRSLLCLLLLSPLAGQGAAGHSWPDVALRTELGSDSLAQVQLAPSGCWDELLLGAGPRDLQAKQGRTAQATVEVWGIAFRETPREEAFSFQQRSFLKSLARAFEQPPPSHGTIELMALMLSDPGHPEKLDLTKVQSMQDRFNRVPHGKLP